jgi:hypothetical protein
MSYIIRNKGSAKVIAFITALIIALSFIPILNTTEAEALPPTASGSWQDYTDLSWYNGHTSPFTISTPQELAGLAAIVNGVAAVEDSFEGDTINIASTIDLSEHYWVPIGGHSPVANGVPTGKFFSGTFNGGLNGSTLDGYKITGLEIDPGDLTNGDGGFGLFGYVNGGSIVNTMIDGSISQSSPNVSLVGGIAGYVYGNVANCYNSVDIYLPASSSSYGSMYGGIVGVLESTTTASGIDDVYIKYCYNEGNITGGSRTGGIVGAVYCTQTNGAVLQADYNVGTIGTEISGSKAYAGGIVGYCRGQIFQVGNTGDVSMLASGHYEAGIAALIQGANPEGNLAQGFSYATITGDDGYIQALYSDVDESTDMPLTDLFWSEEKKPGQTTSPSFGLPSDVQALNAAQFANNQQISTGYGPDAYIVDILNSPAPGTPVFTPGAIVPTILFPVSYPDHQITPISSGTDYDPDDGDAVFADGTAPSGGDGTKENPYNDLLTAMKNAGTQDPIQDVYIRGQFTVSSNQTIDASLTYDTKIIRSSTYNGFLFEIDNGATLTVTNTIIDGNWSVGGGHIDVSGKSIFEVDDGSSLVLTTGAQIRNNFADSGGVARLFGGSATINSTALLTSNSALMYGGAVAVFTGAIHPGSLMQNGGTIQGNSAPEGGGIYIQSGSGTSIFAGTITGNTASSNGSAIYVATGGSLNFDQFNTITIATNNAIYLPDGVLINLAYYVSSPSVITVQCQNPSTSPATNVATGTSSLYVNNSVGQFYYINNAYHFQATTSSSPYYIYLIP